MSNSSYPPIAPPTWVDGSQQALHLESTLQDLPLCCFAVDITRSGGELAEIFGQYPLLVGAALTDQGQFVGMISRRQLLEYLIRPHGLDLFLRESLRVLYSYARSEGLQLPGDTSILAAAQQALRRSPEQQGEPILVQIAADAHYLLDIQALNIAYWQLRGIETQVRYERTQAQMIQSDKMASLGRLVDGVAHEILDPVSFIWGNLSHVTDYSDSVLKLLAAYESLIAEVPPALQRLKADLEIDYVRQDLPQTIESIRTGAERLSKLAVGLQNFCHIDDVYPKPADLHELLDSILLLLKSRLSSEIQVIKHYGYLPPVLCYAGQLNQVFMNILSHAVDALINTAVSQKLALEVQGSPLNQLPFADDFKPTIVITTEVKSLPSATGSNRWISICIADNSPGLSPEAQAQILASFSVERRAMKETSLALSYQIVTAKHGGKFELRSRLCPEQPISNEHEINPPKNSHVLDKIARISTEFEILLPLT